MPSNINPPEILRRLEDRDHSLWPDGNVSPTRLGWLDIPRAMDREARELRQWSDTIDQEVIVLLGMGGSSLGPLVLGSIGNAFGSPNTRRIVVCDTTDPATIQAVPFEDAFMLISSKSGTTLEPNVLYSYARSRVSDPSRYAIITDPGTPLHRQGEEAKVNRVFANDPDIGGRYSVLSYFGMVPAVLLGYDIAELCDAALTIARDEAVDLGIRMGLDALEGRDKATFVMPSEHRSFGSWVEQLIAESTGKKETGIVPVPTSDIEQGDDRQFINVEITHPAQLGAHFFRFEIATAVAGHILGIDPFDEPNVAESKANTNRVLSSLPLPRIPASEPGDLEEFLATNLHVNDYISIQAYLSYGLENALESLRCRIRDNHNGIAVTAGFGPRFLHSTGQLHKGGPDSLVALQVIPRVDRPELAIPGESFDFATLIAAQSIGDNESLHAHKRRVFRVVIDDLSELY